MRRTTYTCRSCLRALRSAEVSNATQDIRRRFIASPSKPAHGLNLILTRTASSIGSQQSTISNNEPFTTSLGHASGDQSRVLLRPNNLYHPWSSSPVPALRRRAAYMKHNAYCPHPSHQRTRLPSGPDDPENRKPESVSIDSSPPAHVSFDCPDCGLPVSCSKDHWEDDYETHLEVCDTLRLVNEDDHDLHSGRFFPEFEYPGPQRAEEFVVNMTNWDTYLYTRDFPAINELRSMRQVTRLLTYPMTITSVLHELSPYNIRSGGRLTNEGLRSFSALRYTAHPPRMGEGGDTVNSLRVKPPPVRIFVLGARAESSLPRAVWQQISYCFPRATFHIIFIGPESMANRDAEFPLPERVPSNPFGGLTESRISHEMKITTYVEYFHTMYAAGTFAPFDPYFDLFVLFHPGLGHPASSHEWTETLPALLETKCPIISTGFTEWDMERDRQWVEQRAGGEYDVLLKPGENTFRSLRWEVNDNDPSDVTCGNWGVWSFRGKRYETLHNEGGRYWT